LETSRTGACWADSRKTRSAVEWGSRHINPRSAPTLRVRPEGAGYANVIIRLLTTADAATIA